MTAPLPRLALVAIFRNEHPYVLEWLAHHRALGVEHFYIADNGSDDGTRPLLQALAALGVLTLIPFETPPGVAPQLLAYTELVERHIAATADANLWLGLIDADEFIIPTGPEQHLPRLLAPLTHQPDVGAIVLNWALYGSSWRLNHSAGLLTERFTRRAPQAFTANRHVKTLVRHSAWAAMGTNPHHVRLQPGWRTLHTDGQTAQWLDAEHPGLSTEVHWQGARLNHYVVKSREEFDTRKRRNGSAATVGRVKGDAYFEAHDRNEHHEALPAPLLAAAHLQLQQLQALLHQHPGGAALLPHDPPATARYTGPGASGGAQGYVDTWRWQPSPLLPHQLQLEIEGWAVNEAGEIPRYLWVQWNGSAPIMGLYEKTMRLDLPLQYPMAGTHCGFRVLCQVPYSALPAPDTAVKVVVYGSETQDGPRTGPFASVHPSSPVPRGL